ncbi:MAG: glycosyltransferase family 4 protein [Planctomycetota bacterium]
MRVAHVITRLCAGGASEALRTLAEAVDAKRFTLDVLHGDVEPGETDVSGEVGQAFKAKFRLSSMRRSVRPWRDFRALQELARVLREGRYDLVHTHTSKAGILGRMAAHQAGIPSVHSTHGHIFAPGAGIPGVGALTRPVFLALERHSARRCRRIFTLSERERQDWISMGVAPASLYEVLPSPLDARRLLAARPRRDGLRKEWGIEPGVPVIVMAGRLAAEKGHATAIRALAQGLDGQLWIAGDGPLRPSLMNLVAAMGLGARVRFLGHRPDFQDWLPLADALVMPSTYEGQGLVALEAFAAGVPVVASNVGGVPEIVVHEVSGLLVPPGDSAALAMALRRLQREPGLAAGLAIRALSRIEAFDPATLAKRLETVYLEVAPLDGQRSSLR